MNADVLTIRKQIKQIKDSKDLPTKQAIYETFLNSINEFSTKCENQKLVIPMISEFYQFVQDEAPFTFTEETFKLLELLANSSQLIIQPKESSVLFLKFLKCCLLDSNLISIGSSYFYILFSKKQYATEIGGKVLYLENFFNICSKFPITIPVIDFLLAILRLHIHPYFYTCFNFKRCFQHLFQRISEDKIPVEFYNKFFELIYVIMLGISVHSKDAISFFLENKGMQILNKLHQNLSRDSFVQCYVQLLSCYNEDKSPPPNIQIYKRISQIYKLNPKHTQFFFEVINEISESNPEALAKMDDAVPFEFWFDSPNIDPLLAGKFLSFLNQVYPISVGDCVKPFFSLLLQKPHDPSITDESNTPIPLVLYIETIRIVENQFRFKKISLSFLAENNFLKLFYIDPPVNFIMEFYKDCITFGQLTLDIYKSTQSTEIREQVFNKLVDLRQYFPSQSDFENYASAFLIAQPSITNVQKCMSCQLLHVMGSSFSKSTQLISNFLAASGLRWLNDLYNTEKVTISDLASTIAGLSAYGRCEALERFINNLPSNHALFKVDRSLIENIVFGSNHDEYRPIRIPQLCRYLWNFPKKPNSTINDDVHKSIIPENDEIGNLSSASNAFINDQSSDSCSGDLLNRPSKLINTFEDFNKIENIDNVIQSNSSDSESIESSDDNQQQFDLRLYSNLKLDPYNSYVLGKYALDHFPLLPSIANRFINSEYVPRAFENHQILELMADPRYDHFPIFQFYPGHQEFQINSRFLVTSFWFKFGSPITSVDVQIFKADAVYVSISQTSLILSFDGQICTVNIDPMVWNYFILKVEVSLLSTTIHFGVNTEEYQMTSKAKGLFKSSEFSSAIFTNSPSTVLYLGSAIRFTHKPTKDYSVVYSEGPGFISNSYDLEEFLILTPYNLYHNGTQVAQTTQNLNLNIVVPENLFSVPYYGFPLHCLAAHNFKTLLSFLENAQSASEYECIFRTICNINIIMKGNLPKFWHRLRRTIAKSHYLTPDLFKAAIKTILTNKKTDEVFSSILYDRDIWRHDTDVVLGTLFEAFPQINWKSYSGSYAFLVNLVLKHPTNSRLVYVLLQNRTKILPVINRLVALIKVVPPVDRDTINWEFIAERKEEIVQQSLIETFSNFIDSSNADFMINLLPYDDMRYLFNVVKKNTRAKLLHLISTITKFNHDYCIYDPVFQINTTILVDVPSAWNDIFNLVSNTPLPNISGMKLTSVSRLPLLIQFIWASTYIMTRHPYFSSKVGNGNSQNENFEEMVKMRNIAIEFCRQHIPNILSNVECIRTLFSYFPFIGGTFGYNFQYDERPDASKTIQTISPQDCKELDDPTYIEAHCVIKGITFPPPPEQKDPVLILKSVLNQLVPNSQNINLEPDLDEADDETAKNVDFVFHEDDPIISLIVEILMKANHSILTPLMHAFIHSTPLKPVSQTFGPHIMLTLLNRLQFPYETHFCFSQLLTFIRELVSLRYFEEDPIPLFNRLLQIAETIPLSKYSVYLHPILIPLFSTTPSSSYPIIFSIIKEHASTFINMISYEKMFYPWCFGLLIASTQNIDEQEKNGNIEFIGMCNELIKASQTIKDSPTNTLLLENLRDGKLKDDKTNYDILKGSWSSTLTAIAEVNTRVPVKELKKNCPYIEFYRLSYDMARRNYFITGKHLLIAKMLGHLLCYPDSNFPIKYANTHWENAVASMRGLLADPQQYSSSQFTLSPRCKPFYPSKLLSPLPILPHESPLTSHPIQDMEISSNQSNEKIKYQIRSEENLNENPMSTNENPISTLSDFQEGIQETETKLDFVSYSEIPKALPLTRERFKLQFSTRPPTFVQKTRMQLFMDFMQSFGYINPSMIKCCDLKRYTDPIQSVSFWYQTAFVVMTYAKLNKTGNDLLWTAPKSETQFQIFADSAFIGQWGKTCLFLDHICLIIPYTSICYILKHPPITFAIWSLNSGHFLLEFSEKDFRIAYTLIDRINDIASNGFPAEQILTLSHTNYDAFSKWSRGKLTTLEYLLSLNALSGRFQADLNNFPYLPTLTGSSPLSQPTLLFTLKNLSKIVPFSALYHKYLDSSKSQSLFDIHVPENIDQIEETENEDKINLRQPNSIKFDNQNFHAELPFTDFYIPQLAKFVEPEIDIEKCLRDISDKTRSDDIRKWTSAHFILNPPRTVSTGEVKSQKISTQQEISSNISHSQEASKLPQHFNHGSTIVEVSRRKMCLKITDSVTNKVFQAENDPLFGYASSICVSADGLFFAVDFVYGTTRAYHIILNHKIPSSFEVLSEISFGANPISAISGADWIAATASGNRLVLWEIATGTIQRVFDFPNEIKDVAFTEENEQSSKIWVAIGSRILIINPNSTGSINASYEISEKEDRLISEEIITALVSVKHFVLAGTSLGRILQFSYECTINCIEIDHGEGCPVKRIIKDGKGYISLNEMGEVKRFGLSGKELEKMESVFTSCSKCTQPTHTLCAFCGKAICNMCMAEHVLGPNCRHCLAFI